MESNLNNKVIDGRALAQALNEQTAAGLKQLSFMPLLCDIVVGEDAASLSYVGIKQRTAEKFGFAFRAEYLPESSTTEQVTAKINEIQGDQNLCGLIVQLPLPPHLDKQAILSAISFEVDVDLLSPKSLEKFYHDQSVVLPPTVGAIMYILEQIDQQNNLNLKDLQFVVAGQGELVGKPIAHELQKRGYKLQAISRDTSNNEQVLLSADIIISGMGQPGLITADMIKENVVIIDAGTSESEGSIKGDVDFDSVAPKAKLITPTPGGVGPLTVSKLLENVLIVAKNKK